MQTWQTFNQHGMAMLDQIDAAVDLAKLDFNFAALRDLEQARTHLEDALTRYNSARYRTMGTWKRADPDALASA